MIHEISIKNFKSVEDLQLPLGRVTVLIGENGSGKSNILEGIAMMGAAAAEKLDEEFLVSRGIRATEELLMLSAFGKRKGRKGPNQNDKISLSAKNQKASEEFVLSVNEDRTPLQWGQTLRDCRTLEWRKGGLMECQADCLLSPEGERWEVVDG